MQFPIQLDILDFVFKGILIGIMASAPMGPVGVLCIQRTLNKGRWYGFVTGIGACVSDIIYALFTGLGMSFMMDIVGNERNRFLLQISGSVVLLLFGIYCYRSNPTKNIHQSNKAQKGKTVFIDARNLGTMVTRKLRELMPDTDIKKISDTFHAFQQGTLEDEKGFCAVCTTEQIAAQDFILTPGRYVGIAEDEGDGVPFEEKMKTLSGELKQLFEESKKQEEEIRLQLKKIGWEV